jgi:ATP-dependent Clp protease protease subunit
MKNGLATSRTIHLQGDVEDCMVEALAGQLAHLQALNMKPVIVTLDSFGGYLTDGLAILDLITCSRAPVYMVAAGAAYSTAALILALGPEERRAATPRTTFLLHATKATTDNELLKNISSYAKFLKEEDRRLNREFCRRTRYQYKKFQDMMDSGEEIWLTAKQALNKGIIDSIWTPEISAEIYREIRGKNPEEK